MALVTCSTVVEGRKGSSRFARVGALPIQGLWVRFLVEELRSLMPQGMVKKSLKK